MQLLAVALKAIAGGTFVVVFSAFSDVLKPKVFAGVFSAAPSVALASLAITVLTTGASKAAVSSRGMVAGATGMIAYCIAASYFVKRFGATAGSIMAWAAWIVPSVIVYGLFLR
jgi:uncharacterized membrane protein (GlpM family)